ncbi:MAG TPA: dienelactone hydrolase family protein [Stellaceae bacterium]|nr:dienelactone hydrolase family protein [Stellaceae bacterium]
MFTTEVMLDVGGSRMAVAMASPDSAGPHPAILVAHHRGGVDDFTRYVLIRLAEIGLVAASPNFYHRRPRDEDPIAAMKHLKDAELVADIDEAIRHLVSMPSVRRDRVGTIGHCLGGRTSYLGLGCNPIFMAAVLLYHGNIFESRGDGMPPPFELTKNIHCPILGISGKDDKNPSPADVARLSAELTRLDIRHDFVAYDGTGHAFQDFHAATQYRSVAADDAWTRLLAFLRAEMFRD